MAIPTYVAIVISVKMNHNMCVLPTLRGPDSSVATRRMCAFQQCVVFMNLSVSRDDDLLLFFSL